MKDLHALLSTPTSRPAAPRAAVRLARSRALAAPLTDPLTDARSTALALAAALTAALAAAALKLSRTRHLQVRCVARLQPLAPRLLQPMAPRAIAPTCSWCRCGMKMTLRRTRSSGPLSSLKRHCDPQRAWPGPRAKPSRRKHMHCGSRNLHLLWTDTNIKVVMCSSYNFGSCHERFTT